MRNTRWSFKKEAQWMLCLWLAMPLIALGTLVWTWVR
jgi:hypothetical protein